MARTIELSLYAKDRANDKYIGGKKAVGTYVTANNGEFVQRQSIGTSEVTISLPASIGNAGLCIIENNDATNFVDVGFATGNYPLRVPKGQPMQLWLTPATATLYLKSDTAPCDVSVAIIEA